MGTLAKVKSGDVLIRDEVTSSRRRGRGRGFEIVSLVAGNIWVGQTCEHCTKKGVVGDLIFVSKNGEVIIHAKCVESMASSLVHGVHDDKGARHKAERDNIQANQRW